MISLIFPSPRYGQLVEALSHDALESAAILLCQPVSATGGNVRLLVRDIRIAGSADYLERSATSVSLATSFCLAAEQRAVREGLSLVYCHTHLHDGAPAFSSIDDVAELELKSYLAARRAAGPHGALVFSRDQVIARRLGEIEPIQVIEIGPEFLVRTGAEVGSAKELHDRQVRAFGPDGQARIAAMRVAVVGLGGTGSLVLQQLAHLGVRRFVLVDPDVVEVSNLNRLVGAVAADVGLTPKVGVAERLIRSLTPDAEILSFNADVTRPEVAEGAAGADLIFSCTDTHASRHVLNQIAYQYIVPVFDMGVSITATEHGAQLAGHAKMLAPGLPCLWCARHLSADEVRREMMTDVQRAADPYFQGGTGVVQPSVISLNGTMASLAVTMFLSAVAGVPSPPRYLSYDGNRGRVNALEAKAEPGCPFCGEDAPIGWGGAAPLPVRNG
jgi:molybdopterin/thiamine biosynthesis adenylyltransferase